MVTEAIILAGGLGTRLRSVVSDLPKSMAPIAGQPFLAYLLQLVETNGVSRVVLAVGYRSEAIREYFGTRYGNLKLYYSVEKEPLGTGGALRQALEQTQGPFAFVLNGDTFLQLDYQRFGALLERDPAAKMAIALRRIGDASRYGAALLLDGRIEEFSARGTRGGGLINAGSYVVVRELFSDHALPASFSLERDFIEPFAPNFKPIAFECTASFIDIGVPEALEAAQTLIPRWVSESAQATARRI